MSGRRRWGVIAAVVVAGVAVAAWALWPRSVGIVERLRTVEGDAALSVIPPGATLIEADGNDCPDAPGVGPYFNWRYTYKGDQDSVFSFYNERLKKDSWDPVPPPASDAASPRYPAQHYAKSYGSWEAHATVRFYGRKEFALGVSVDDKPPKGCE
jgi:hypothetical protein